jgi:hypothetical protein
MGPDDIGADAVTICLKTSGNALSLWTCSEDPADIHQIALALALGTDKDRVDTMDVILLPKDLFAARGFVFTATPGQTKLDDLKDRHLDMAELTLAKLSEVAHLIRDGVRQNADVHRVTVGMMLNLIIDALDNKRIDEANLDATTRAAIQKKRAGG